MNERYIYAFIIGFCDGAFVFFPALALVLYDINNVFGYFISIVVVLFSYLIIRSTFPIPITNEWVENNDS